ncbi:hypothetical protein FKM82_002009 [Ascaphus truei]
MVSVLYAVTMSPAVTDFSSTHLNVAEISIGVWVFGNPNSMDLNMLQFKAQSKVKGLNRSSYLHGNKMVMFYTSTVTYLKAGHYINFVDTIILNVMELVTANSYRILRAGDYVGSNEYSMLCLPTLRPTNSRPHFVSTPTALVKEQIFTPKG